MFDKLFKLGVLHIMCGDPTCQKQFYNDIIKLTQYSCIIKSQPPYIAYVKIATLFRTPSVECYTKE